MEKDKVLKESVIFISEEGVLVDSINGKIHKYNDVGVKILNLIDMKKSNNQIIDQLAQDYNVSRDQVSEDVLEFINELEEIGLVDDK